MKATLRTHRIDKGFSQVEFAKQLSVSEVTYRKWEKNPLNIRVGKMVQISKILGISTEDIIFFENKPNYKVGLEISEVTKK
ncbi:MAG: helix-turn-helix transcriptional regulator [Culicoidibacterales bacterium]